MTNLTPLFAEHPLDRMDHLRDDIALHRDAASLDKRRYLVIFDNQVVVAADGRECLLRHQALADLPLAMESLVFLGGDQGLHYFAIRAIDMPGDDFECIGIRRFANDGWLADGALGLVAEANSLLLWHQHHGFCARCGNASESAHGGWRRDCPACEAQHFPRTDPVAIMLVTEGDRCLLGRGHHFDEQRYSCLAGFLEPGETIEAAARRELFEEAGVRGGKVQYLASQPWPFPSSLMIGMQVEAETTALNIDSNELADAIWVDKADVRAVLEGATDRGFLLPPRIAIARTLLQAWVDGV